MSDILDSVTAILMILVPLTIATYYLRKPDSTAVQPIEIHNRNDKRDEQ